MRRCTSTTGSMTVADNVIWIFGEPAADTDPEPQTRKFCVTLELPGEVHEWFLAEEMANYLSFEEYLELMIGHEMRRIEDFRATRETSCPDEPAESIDVYEEMARQWESEQEAKISAYFPGLIRGR